VKSREVELCPGGLIPAIWIDFDLIRSIPSSPSIHLKNENEVAGFRPPDYSCLALPRLSILGRRL